jgi:hypothetical protein
MQAIQVWSVVHRSGAPEARALEEVSSAEAEAMLEDILVASPDLLLPGVTLVGRQIPTEGGPLDLLGIDGEGQLVVFELKRGTLTRDAVAQVLDYASDLTMRSPEDVAQLIERHSGANGIESITDFLDWYGREYPDVSEFEPDQARMVLVGLGVDDRARRVVNFLAQRGIDIQLLTFHGFREEGQLFLAKQVETQGPARAKGAQAQSKESNRKQLHALALEMDALDVLEEVAEFIGEHLPSAYRWPGKTAYSFSLQEQTEEGRPTLRSYATLYVHPKKRGCVTLTFPERAVDAAPGAFEGAAGMEGWSMDAQKWIPFQVDIARESWSRQKDHVRGVLTAVYAGWERAREDSESMLNSDTGSP